MELKPYKNAYLLAILSFVLQCIGQIMYHQNGTCGNGQQGCTQSSLNTTLPCGIAKCNVGECVFFSTSFYGDSHLSCSLPTSWLGSACLGASVTLFGYSIALGVINYLKEKRISCIDVVHYVIAPVVFIGGFTVFLVLFLIPSYMNPNFTCNGNAIMCGHDASTHPLCTIANCSQHMCLGVKDAQWTCMNVTNMGVLQGVAWFVCVSLLAGTIGLAVILRNQRQEQRGLHLQTLNES